MNMVMKMTVNDYQRLLGFIELASYKSKMSGVTNQLMERLDKAKLFPQKEIAKSVVTMNSRVQLRYLTNNRSAEICITYPQDSDPRERRVSVFSEIGLALLGRKENDIVSWRVPGGTGQFQIEKVIYQPEAAGDYSL
jgi:regulator of nucleoside diphosphate kinase